MVVDCRGFEHLLTRKTGVRAVISSTWQSADIPSFDVQIDKAVAKAGRPDAPFRMGNNPGPYFAIHFLKLVLKPTIGLYNKPLT